MGCMRNSGTICPVTKPSPVALFKGLGNHEIPVIRDTAAKRTFQASQIIIRAEEPAVRLFVIEVGSVDYYIVTNDGRDILLRRLVPGNAFGFATFLSEPTGYLGTKHHLACYRGADSRGNDGPRTWPYPTESAVPLGDWNYEGRLGSEGVV